MADDTATLSAPPREKSMTIGAVCKALSQEFPGQYHYLHFVSDSSVTASGVTLDAQWR